MADLLDSTTVATAVDVNASTERAFDLFTERIGSWWDADKHILEAPLASMEFEPFVGGHIIDRGTDGSECRWARILAYDPPRRVVFSWDINVQWQIETDPSRCSEVEITFTAVENGLTRVQLTHRHLDRHGPGWESMRDAVAGGWSLDGFRGFAEAAEPPALPEISDETMRARLSETKSYTLALLYRTEKYSSPAVDPVIWEHGRRNMALVAAGELQVVMPVGDETGLAGIGVFGGDERHVAAILAGDPAIRAGVLRYTLHTARGFPGSALG
jgi:uncharacterized protein YndB with AHSA1/START domain